MGYAKRILKERSETRELLGLPPLRAISPLAGVTRVKGISPRIYIVNGVDNLKALARKVATAYFCECGTLYAWFGAPDPRPECPGCRILQHGKLMILKSQTIVDAENERIAEYKAKNAYNYKDGVYVDVSLRNGHMVLGFAIVEDEHGKFVSCSSENQADTSAAETEAAMIAQAEWPHLRVFCDHRETCDKVGCNYISRKDNALAHKVARDRINFKGWITA